MTHWDGRTGEALKSNQASEQASSARCSDEPAVPERHEVFHDEAPVSYFTLTATPPHRIAEVNASGSRLLGSGAAELLGKTLASFMTPESEPTFDAFVSHILESDECQECELEMVKNGGTRFHAVLHGRRLARTREIVISVSDITRFKTVEAALRESERDYREMADLLAEGIFSCDLTGTVTYVNHKTFTALGLTEDDLKNGLKIFDVLAPESIETAKQRFAKVLRQEDVGVGEYMLMRKDRTTFPALVHTLAVVRRGRVVGARGILFDISDRKHAEIALQESERKYRELAEMMGAMIFEADARGKVTYANRMALTSFGLTEDDLTRGVSVFDFNLPEEEAMAREKWAMALKREEVGSIEYTVRRKDGTTFPALAQGSAITRDGRVVGLRGVIFDISDRKRAENAVKESEKKYRELTDLLDEGVFEVDPAGTVTYANRKGLAYLGLKDEDMRKTHNIFDVIAREDWELAGERISRVLKQEDIGAVEYRIKRRDGTVFPALIHSSAIVRGAKVVGVRGVLVDISDRKRAEVALQESERKYRELAELLDAGIFELDSSGDLTYSNPKGLSLFGLSDEDVLRGVNVFDVIVTDNIEVAKQNFAKVLSHEDVGAVEYTLKRRDGSTFSALTYGSAIMRDGTVVGMRGIVVDISELKKAEQALKDSERRYRELTDLLDEGVFEIDLDGRFTYANRKGLSSFGIDESDLKGGITVFDIIAPQDQQLAQERLASTLNGEDTGAVEFVITRKNGTTFPALTHGSAIMRDGVVTGIRGVVFDISELKRTERALRESEERVRTLLKSLHEGIWVLDKDDITTFVNPRMAEMLGYTEDEMLGKLPYQFSDAEWQKATTVYMERRRQGISEQLEAEFLHRDGHRVYTLMEASPILDGQGNYVGSIAGVQDITDRKISEEILKQTMAELDRSNKELEQFAYVTSHDLREPLRMMSSFAQSLEKRYKDQLDQRANEYIDFIVDGASRMQRLIDDILIYSRVSTRGQPFEAVNMDDVLQYVLVNLTAAVDETGAVITYDPLPMIQADRGQMTQVLQNLIGNAIKFHRDDETPMVHVSQKRQGQKNVFSVKDNGIGIDPELFDRLFNLFQRLHTQDKYPGTGVGLAVTKKIVERHGGRVWVESEPGRGSTFNFSIPDG